MGLKDIIGQERVIEMLTGSLCNDRIAHAYLFKGEDGIGKKLTATGFAKTLNCQNPVHGSQLTADSREKHSFIIDCCDICSSCTKIDKASHPDVVSLAPEDGQIKVGVIRTLAESLSFKAFEGKWKIVIIDEADTLNQSAANAFLKTLEEPPGQSIIILISSKPELIPSTIRSRCQIINFSPLPSVELSELIENKYSNKKGEITAAQAMLLGLISGGRPGWALDKDLIKTRDRTFSEFHLLLSRVDEDLWPDRDAMEEWFDWVQLWLRDIAVFRVTGKNDLLINQDLEKQIRDISRKTGLKDILKLSDIFYTIRKSLRYNLNKQLTLFHTHLLLKRHIGG
jgi:DNA polymerase-3 subunit delta'